MCIYVYMYICIYFFTFQYCNQMSTRRIHTLDQGCNSQPIQENRQSQLLNKRVRHWQNPVQPGLGLSYIMMNQKV